MTITTDSGAPADARELVERLGAVREELCALARSPFGSFSEAEAGQVVARVEGVTRAEEALVTACAGGIDRGQAWTATGFRAFSQWWRVHTHRRRSTASATQLLARDLVERLPLTGRALAQGRLGGEHAKVMARFTKTEAQREQLLDESMGEAFLVRQAQQLPVEEFTRVVKSWATRTDPEAADRRWRESSAKRELFVAPVLDGTDVHGWLGLEEGQLVTEALQAIIGTPPAEDERTPAQRRADALVQLCRLFLDAGLAQPGSRIRPHIAITIEYATLERLVNATGPEITFGELFGQLVHTRPTSHDADHDAGEGTARSEDAGEGAARSEDAGEGAARSEDAGGGTDGGVAFGLAKGEADRGRCCGGAVIPAGVDRGLLRGVAPGTFADGTPIPFGQLAKLLCDGEFHRVVFGPEGQVLDSGRTQRLFTAAQARAIIARDRCCQFPGCGAPPGVGEIHHCLWWYHGGATSAENGVLLCWWHHTLVHQRHLTISRHDHSGRGWWEFTTRAGLPVRDVPPPADALRAGDARQPDPPRRE